MSKQLDLLLGGVTSLLNLLGSLLGTVGEFLGLVLNLLVQTLEDGQDGALDALFGLYIGIDKGLSVGAHVLEETSNTAKALVEVVAFLQRVVDSLLNNVNTYCHWRKAVSSGLSYLECLLILLGVVAVDSLHSLHIFLNITDSMLPCLESLGEQASSLFTKTSAQSLLKVVPFTTAHCARTRRRCSDIRLRGRLQG